MSLLKAVELAGPFLERGTVGHLLARLLGLVDEASPWLAKRLTEGGGKYIEAAQRHLELSGFLDDLLEQPRGRWSEVLASGSAHHGPLLSILLGNVALRRLPGRPGEALELTRLARMGSGDDEQVVDAEIGWLIDAVEAVARRLLGQSPENSRRLLRGVRDGLEQVGFTIHPELVADARWLCAVYWRLSGQLALARADLDVAISWAEFIEDPWRLAEYELEKGLVLELSSDPGQACEADARAWQALRRYRLDQGHVLVARTVRQWATHLVDAGRPEEAREILDEREAVFRNRFRSSSVRIHGCIAKQLQEIEDAELFLETAEVIAEIDGDWAEQGLAALERIALFDDLGRWAERGEALRDLIAWMMASEHAPPEIVRALAEIEQEGDSERAWDGAVVGCLRRRFRMWLARESYEVYPTVM